MTDKILLYADTTTYPAKLRELRSHETAAIPGNLEVEGSLNAVGGLPVYDASLINQAAALVALHTIIINYHTPTGED